MGTYCQYCILCLHTFSLQHHHQNIEVLHVLVQVYYIVVFVSYIHYRMSLYMHPMQSTDPMNRPLQHDRKLGHTMKYFEICWLDIAYLYFEDQPDVNTR